MAQTEQAPSIGGIDINYDPRGNRVRQILRTPIHDAFQLPTVLNRLHFEAELHGATRRLVRAVTANNSLANVFQVVAYQGWKIEALYPLDGDFSGYSFVYYARNNPSRISNPEVLAQEDVLFRGVKKRPTKTPAQHLRRASAGGFSLERLKTPLSSDDYASLVKMYRYSFSSYPFDIAASIRGMVSDEQTHVYAARQDQTNQLVAISATEEVIIPIQDGRVLTIREMGDSAKIGSWVNGLNAPLKIMLITEASRRGTNLLFCETRAALGAVNAINWSIGMQPGGFLNKHTVISGPQDVQEVELDGEENGRFGNMRFWGLNESQVNQIGLQVVSEMP